MTSFPNVADMNVNCPTAPSGANDAPTRLRRLEMLSRIPLTDITNGSCLDFRETTGKAECRA